MASGASELTCPRATAQILSLSKAGFLQLHILETWNHPKLGTTKPQSFFVAKLQVLGGNFVFSMMWLLIKLSFLCLKFFVNKRRQIGVFPSWLNLNFNEISTWSIWPVNKCSLNISYCNSFQWHLITIFIIYLVLLNNCISFHGMDGPLFVLLLLNW